MNEDLGPDFSLVALNSNVEGSIAFRIDRRLSILLRWNSAGDTGGQPVPKNLVAARLWNNPQLGVTPIISPNEFTKKHPIYGEKVAEIERLIAKLKPGNSVFDRQGGVRDGTRKHSDQGPEEADQGSASNIEIEFGDLELIVSQWHSERDARLSTTKAAESWKARFDHEKARRVAGDKRIEELEDEIRRRDISQVR